MKKQVLIIEDDIDTLDRIGRIIENAADVEAHVLKATSGSDALKIVQHFPVDIIILDVFLPDYNGIELGKKIRELHEKIPIVVETAMGDTDFQIYAHKQIRYISFLHKPYEDELFEDEFKLALRFGDMNTKKYIKVKVAGNYQHIAIDNIVYIEKIMNQEDICIYEYYPVSNKITETIVEWWSLKKIVNDLSDKRDLVMCHRSFIINPNYIKSVNLNKKIIYMEHISHEIPIGRICGKNFLSRWFNG